MKLPWFALLSIGTAAFCQSNAQRPVNPDKLFQLPDKFAEQAPDLGRLKPQPFLWNNSILPPRAIPPPRIKPDNRQIDPKIILRPPWRQPKQQGQDFAHHLYPDLKFLPLRRGPHVSR